MPRATIEIDKVGKVGIVTDRIGNALPPGAWSAGNNVRFEGSSVGSMPGYEAITPCAGTWYYLMPIFDGDNYYWYHFGTAGITVWNGLSCTDVTRASGAYTGASADRWNGCVLNNLPVLTNGKDAPQYQTAPGTTAFTDLIWDGATTWTTQGVSCKVIRAFKDFLLAFDITESGVRDPQRYLWSNPSEPGAIPATWDYTSASNVAGDGAFSQTSGRCIDGMSLGDEFVVYKEDSIHALQYIGESSQFVFRERTITNRWGMIAQGCVVDIGGRHIFLSYGDVMMMDGNQVSSIADTVVRQAIFDDLDPDAYKTCFLVHHESHQEVWVCYPGTGQSFPNKTAVYNYSDRTWSFRDLPANCAHIAHGIDLSTAQIETFDTDLGQTFDTWVGTFGDLRYNPTVQTLYAAAGSAVYKFEGVATYGGSNPTCYAQRSGIELGGKGRASTILRIYPVIDGDGSAITVMVGHHQDADDAITWDTTTSFVPGTDVFVPVRSTGLQHAIRFQSANGSTWRLYKFDIEYATAGRR